MTKYSTKTTLRVRYGETDQMGVVYHGNYAQYFEVARIEWLDQIGISYKQMEKDGVILPVVALETQFKNSAYFDDELTILTTLKEEPTAKIEFEYEVYNKDKLLLTTGSTVLVFVSKKSKRPTKCPQKILNLIKNF